MTWHRRNRGSLIGAVSHALTVIDRAERPAGVKYAGQWWLCECECGSLIPVHAHRIRKKIQKSCGCAVAAAAAARAAEYRLTQEHGRCPICKTEFTKTARHQVYCSRKCKRIRHSQVALLNRNLTLSGHLFAFRTKTP